MKLILRFVLVFPLFIAAPIYGDVYNATNFSHNYGSITAAVSAAASGDTILVSTGAYAETVNIYNTILTIDGGYSNNCQTKSGSGYTVIDSDDSGFLQKVTIRITNAVVRLEDLDIVDGSVSPSITRNGGGLIISGGSAVTASQVRVYNNSCFGYGGGVYVKESELSLIDSQVYSNFAWTAAMGRAGNGGGIAADNAIIMISDSPVADNWATVSGGGIYVQSGAVVTVTGGDSDIENNNAEYGGGIYVTNATLYVQGNADVQDNIATNDGGAIYLTAGATGIVEGSSTYIGYSGSPNIAALGCGGGCFVDNSTLYLQDNAVIGTNSAALSGGGIYLVNDAFCVIDNAKIGRVSGSGVSSFANNGGGVAVIGSTLILTNNATIANCIASERGGGIYASNSTVRMYSAHIGGDSTNTANWAGQYGGGIYMYRSSLEMQDTGFSNNITVAYGGGFYSYLSGIVASNCVLQNNRSAFGGGGYTFYTAVDMVDSVIYDNYAAQYGGGLYCSGGSNINYSACDISGNIADLSGGGIALNMAYSATSVFENVIFTNNSAYLHAGGVYVSGGGPVRFRDSSIRNNQADSLTTSGGVGGGLWMQSSADVSMESISDHCYITENSGGDGGGIYAKGSSSVELKAVGFHSIYITSNTSTNMGGAICMMTGTELRVVGHVNIGQNAAKYGGGIFINSNAMATLTWTNGYDPYLYFNRAGRYGGGMYVTGPETFVTLRGVSVGSDAAGNYATNYGGGISLHDHAEVDSINSIFVKNESGLHGGGIYLIDGCQLSLRSDASEGTNAILPLSQVRENVATINGGGIYSDNDSVLTIADTLLYSNSAANYGGAIYARSVTTSLLYNALMVDNSAGTTGNAVRVYGTGTRMEIVQSTIAGNGAFGSVAIGTGASLFMSNSIVEGGVTTGETVRFCNIFGGYPGAGNFDRPSRFIDSDNMDYRLSYGSSCTNRGTSISWITNDCMGATRPIGQYDIGAYEYDGAVYDSDGDTMVDQWEAYRKLNPTNAADALIDTDGDFSTNVYEYVADTDPLNSNDYFRIINIATADNTNTIVVSSSSRRIYSLDCNDAIGVDSWTEVAGQTNLPGSGSAFGLVDTNSSPVRTYRVNVRLPE